MCGIAGVQHSDQKPDTIILHSFAKALSHRGPDDAGIEIYDHTAFVHTRLSIIDITHGHQPLKDDREVSLIVNGEIYNYWELYQQFKDYPFKTASDCETILPLYEKYDLEFVHHLRGMYALALYDPAAQRLILARDPFGIKPLYYLIHNNSLFFASEPHAFIKAHLLKPVIQPESRAELLQLRYNTGADLLIEQVQRVRPGELLVIEKGKILQRHYRSALTYKPRAKKLTLSAAVTELGNVLEDSVRVHLRSDVPYGLFLSGGLDSATILHLMSKNTEQSVKTYTIGFSHTAVHDERDQARHLAQLYKTDHTELDYTAADFWRDLPMVTSVMDDPIFDQAMLPTYKLAAEARKSVKVILCGEGGDELLCGYRRYQKALLPWWLGGRIMREKGTFVKADIHNEHLQSWQTPLNSLRDKLAASLWDESKTINKLQIAQSIDCASWLPNNLLIKLDRCLMAHGIEGRTPFLDPIVADFCFNLPNNMKIRRGHGKWLLRQWLDHYMPASRPFAKKRGFRVPVEAWIKAEGSRLSQLVAQQPGIKDLFPTITIHEIFTSTSPKTSYIAWMLLTYAVWHQIFIMNQQPIPDTWAFLSR